MPRQPTAVFAKTDRKCSNRTEALHHPTVAASGGSATGQQRSAAGRAAGRRLSVQARTSGRLGRGPWGERDREKRLCHGWCHGLLAVPSLTRRSPEAPTPRGLIGSHRGVYAFRQFGHGGPPLSQLVPSPLAPRKRTYPVGTSWLLTLSQATRPVTLPASLPAR